MILEYEDDLFITGNNVSQVNEIVTKIMETFEARTINNLEKGLGTEIEDSHGKVMLHHKGLIENELKVFQMADWDPSPTPMAPGTDLVLDEAPVLTNICAFSQLVGSLLYISNSSRPCIAFADTYLSKVRQKLTISYMKCAKHVLRYPTEPAALGLKYKRGETIRTWETRSWTADKIDLAGNLFLSIYSGFLMLLLAGGAKSRM